MSIVCRSSVLALLLLLPAGAAADEATTRAARAFVRDHEKRIKKLDVASNLAWWEASTTGSKEAFARKVEAQNRIDEALADRKVFARLTALRKKRKDIDDAVLARAI